MFDVSIFSCRVRGNGTSPPVDAEDGHGVWELATAAGVPSLVVVVLLLLLLKQNVEAVRGAIESLNRLIASLDLPSFGRANRGAESVEMAAQSEHDLPSAGRPRNLTDEEIVRMTNAPVGTEWV